MSLPKVFFPSARGLADDLKAIASKKGEADPGQVKGAIIYFVETIFTTHFVFFHSGTIEGLALGVQMFDA